MSLPADASHRGRRIIGRLRLDRVPGSVWVALCVFVILAVYSVTRYSQYLVSGYDLGIFDQAVRQYSRFSAPYVALKGDSYNVLGDHFHPILIILAPLYWIWDDARMLLLAQAALIALSIPVVDRMIARRVGSWQRWALLLGYSLGWPLQRMVDFDFHEIAFAVPLLALAIDALDEDRDKPLVLACAALLLVREDMGMVVRLFGLLRALRRRPRRVGVALAAVGVTAFVLITGWVLPAMSPNGTFAYWSYTALGPDAPSAIVFMVVHPWQTVQLFFLPGQKTVTLIWLLGPVLFCCLRSPYFILCLPLLAQRFFSSRVNLWSTQFHYNAPIWTICFLAAIDGLSRIRSDQGRRWVTTALAVTTAAVPVVGIATRNSNFALQRLSYSAWRQTEHMQAQRAARAAIPTDTCVEADDRMAAQFTRTNRVTLPTLSAQSPDYYVLDMSQAETGLNMPPRAGLRPGDRRGLHRGLRAGDDGGAAQGPGRAAERELLGHFPLTTRPAQGAGRG